MLNDNDIIMCAIKRMSLQLKGSGERWTADLLSFVLSGHHVKRAERGLWDSQNGRT